MVEEPSARVPGASDVISALNRTGFLLEYQVAQVLRGHGFTTDLNSPFPDPETGKSREMDLRADIERSIVRQPVSVYVSVEVIIECKNTSNPFLLIGERGQRLPGSGETILISFDPLLLTFSPGRWESVEFALKLDELPGMLTGDDFFGRQLLRMNREHGNWRADNSGVYDSIIYPLMKASQYVINKHKEVDYDDEDDDGPWNFPSIDFLFPMVVTSGPVLTVTVQNDGPVVNEVGWAPVQRAFRYGHRFENIIVDVVSFDHFDQYLRERVDKVLESAHASIISNIHLFDPEWLLANRGQPEDIDVFNAWLESIRKSRNSAEPTGRKA